MPTTEFDLDLFRAVTDFLQSLFFCKNPQLLQVFLTIIDWLLKKIENFDNFLPELFIIYVPRKMETVFYENFYRSVQQWSIGHSAWTVLQRVHSAGKSGHIQRHAEKSHRNVLQSITDGKKLLSAMIQTQERDRLRRRIALGDADERGRLSVDLDRERDRDSWERDRERLWLWERE